MDQKNERIILGPDGNPINSSPQAAPRQEPKPQAEAIQQQPELQQAQGPAREDDIVIPVIEETMTVDKELVETGKVRVRKIVTEEEASLNIPLVQETYDIRRVPMSKVYEKAPVPRQEGETIIVPVVKEVLVIEKRYEVIEEVHLTRKVTSTPHIQQITLLRERVEVIRTDSNGRRTVE